MEHTIRIENGCEADLCRLFALARSTFGEMLGWNDAVVMEPLKRDVVFVARCDDTLAGYVALWETPRTVRVDQLLVAEPRVPELIGDRLLDYAEGYAIWRGARSLEIVVEPDNAAARRLYSRHGFVPVAEELFARMLPTL